MRLPTLLCLALLATLFAVNVYRASTQSITVDEAFTSNAYLGDEPSDVKARYPYNVNLNSMLMRVSSRVLPTSEFSVRLPSLLGGVLYFVALFLLSRRLFGDTSWMLLAVCLASLNPFLLDYLSAARGYSLAMAFLTLGMYFALRWLDQPSKAGYKFPILTGIALGLAIASHITAVFAVAAIEATMFVLLLAVAGRVQLRSAALMMAVTAAVVLAILWGPLQHTRVEAVDGVAPLFRDGIRNVVRASLLYKPTLLIATDPVGRFVLRVGWWLLPILLVCLGAAAARVAFRRRRGIDDTDRALLLFAGAVLGTFFLLRIEPPLAHHGFFSLRRLLFTLPLISLAAPLFLRWLSPKPVFGALLWIVVLQFALQSNTRYYYDWEFDAGMKTLMRSVHRKPPVDGKMTRLAVDWPMSESAKFYAKLYGYRWLADPWPWGPQSLSDYYIVQRRTLPSLSRFGLVQIAHDTVSDTVLAEISDTVRRRHAFLLQSGIESKIDTDIDLNHPPERIEMGQPQAKAAMLQDFMGDPAQDKWVWTFERPAFLLTPPAGRPAHFEMTVQIPPVTFRQTGPVELTVWINGKRLASRRFSHPGENVFTAPLPPEILAGSDVALVETTLDKYYVAPDDGKKLGYLLVRAGFAFDN